MGQCQSTPQKILKLAKQGRHAELQLLLLDLARNDRYYQTNRVHYLEIKDEAGNTPLIAAAARGSYDCVVLLLDQGANIHHQNRRAEGGSALHEAVARRHDRIVDLLLRCGGSPFTENAKGFTAMDIACANRNAALVRLLERAAPFHGWLMMKVPRFGGLGSTWERRYCVICHRFPYPHAPRTAQLTHVVFLAYKTDTATTPVCRAWLDGARAREFYHPNAVARINARGAAQAAIVLHRKHDVPAGAYVTGRSSTSSEGYTFYLRPDDGSQRCVDTLQRFMDLVNNRGFPPPAPSPSPSAGSGAAVSAPTSTYQQLVGSAMAETPGVWIGPLAQGFAAAVAAGAAGTAASSTGVPAPEAAGSSDEDLARRLQAQYDQEAAAHYTAHPEQEMSTALPSYTTSAAPTPVAQASQDLTGFAAAAAGEEGRYPRPFGSTIGGGSGPSSLPVTPSGPSGQSQQQTSRPGHLGSSSSAPEAVMMASLTASQQPSAPPLISLDSPHQSPQPARPATAPADNWFAHLPPAPTARPVPLPSLTPSAPGGTGPAAAAALPLQDEDENTCVMCLDREAVAGVLHKETVHRCLCRECAQELKDNNVRNCPVCRESIECFIMQVYG